ncbi:SDR family NAD(P)-dependent oxidoreductase [Amorphoplanes digitatis]|uniref:NAD(P)-dependent dehydrogenase (Short-subunit alcohol dehydrogenase family) n=1 Tax=Actinoplanes digitatis TaxID=1868 RepID=A0A7W7HZY7_9ACTN|nr:SDR family NAD(P)-dependent oxidoreductase [Actinoplanes digitatis]MBB4763877.1 NAD(P)-dependent dehydrogenase (short-subunit alcohol dehydrogenase family) [Actinoplanes digitatis]GID95642.1 short-chain dehydrogenase [Actinoplanes digitatis]
MPVAIITGASRGLGLALTAGLADAGWRLVVDARGAGDLAAAMAKFDVDRVVAVPGDVTDAAHRHALIAAADRLGGTDLLVNNAGILGPSPQPPLADYPLGALREVYEVNVVAPLALIQLALPGLRSRRGAIVTITSDAAVEAYPGWGGYGSAKAAIEQAGRVIAAEEPAVRVWSVDPGDLRTRMHQEAFPGQDISDRPLPATVVPAFRRLLGDAPPSGRIRLADLLAGAGR